MKKLYLIKAAQARPFVETASRLGAPVETLALHADLPLPAVSAGEGVIGEPSLWRFVEVASEVQGCDQLGYLTALDHPVTRSGQLGDMAISLGRSLKDILDTFCREVVKESDGSSYRLGTRDGKTWFTRELMLRGNPGGWQAEQYVLTFVIQIIRLCAPGDWLPRHIRLATRDRPTALPAEWSSISVEWGWPRTEMLIDDDVLGLEPRFPAAETPLSPDSANTERNTMMIQDLVDRQIWSRQTGLDGASRELGMSSSTLKRRLADLGTTYSKLLEQRRYRWACQLLSESDLAIREIASGLGYEHQSNFTRAFIRMSGQSPVAYRKEERSYQVGTDSHPRNSPTSRR